MRLKPKQLRDGFRLMFHVDGDLISVDKGQRATLEKAVAAAIGARPSPRGGCQEFWVIGRRDLNVFLFAQRLAKPFPVRQVKGALSRELSALLVAASGPRTADRMLDPFGGSGSLPLARLAWPAASVQYNDLDLKGWLPELPQELVKSPRVRLTAEDATVLPGVPTGSMDAVITDPPWGEHERIANYSSFVAATCDTLARVLNQRTGRYVFLVNRRGVDLYLARLAGAGLYLGPVTEVLINGHPASVLTGTAVATSSIR
jgi:hypothetical protein